MNFYLIKPSCLLVSLRFVVVVVVKRIQRIARFSLPLPLTFHTPLFSFSPHKVWLTILIILLLQILMLFLASVKWFVSINSVYLVVWSLLFTSPLWPCIVLPPVGEGRWGPQCSTVM